MIDTQRLDALLRAWLREDAVIARLRTPPAASVRPSAPIGPELPAPDHEPSPAARSAASAQSAALRLSDAGRMLLSALREDGEAPLPQPGSPLPPHAGSAAAPELPGERRPTAVPPRPLLRVPPQSASATDRLALQLKDAVEFSGVFYESHLAQWADDMRPRALLAREPQARWSGAADIAIGSAGAHPTSANDALPLLRQQLDVLDSGRFAWHGELWPGQSGTLTIEEDDAPRPHAPEAIAAAPRWRMRVTLAFPELGTIDATVGLAGDALNLALHCERPAIALRLRGGAPALRAAIADRALDLAFLSIAHEPAA